MENPLWRPLMGKKPKEEDVISNVACGRLSYPL